MATGLPSFVEQPSTWDTVIIAGRALPGLCRIKGDGFERRVQRTKSAGNHNASMQDMGDDVRDFTIECRIWKTEHLRALEDIIPLLTKKTKVPGKENASAPESQRLYLDAGGLPLPQLYPSQVMSRNGDPYLPTPDMSRVDETERLLSSITTPATPPKASTSMAYRPVEVQHPALRLFGIKSLHVVKVTLPQYVGEGIWELNIHCVDHIPKAQRTGQVTQAMAGRSRLEDIKTAIPEEKPPSKENVEP